MLKLGLVYIIIDKVTNSRKAGIYVEQVIFIYQFKFQTIYIYTSDCPHLVSIYLFF